MRFEHPHVQFKEIFNFHKLLLDYRLELLKKHDSLVHKDCVPAHTINKGLNIRTCELAGV